MNNVELLKKITGIEHANCFTCAHLGSYSEGDFGEHSWLECDKHLARSNLKSFPFKKEMPCWEPEFWHSKFAGGDYEDFKNAIK